MPFCRDCGRNYDSQCICLNSKSPSKREALAILYIVMILPIPVLAFFSKQPNIFDANFFFLGNISLVIILLLLTLATIIFKKSYLAMFFSCHQLTTRSFFLFKRPLNICSRCTGIYLGIMLSLTWGYIKLPWYVYLIVGIPMLVDGFLQEKHKIKSNNIRRFITGFLFAPTLIYVFSLYSAFIVYLGRFIVDKFI